jgi:hypothetical protein
MICGLREVPGVRDRGTNLLQKEGAMANPHVTTKPGRDEIGWGDYQDLIYGNTNIAKAHQRGYANNHPPASAQAESAILDIAMDAWLKPLAQGSRATG